MSEERMNPEIEPLEAFVEWLKADWAHIALVILAILFIIVLIVLLTRRR